MSFAFGRHFENIMILVITKDGSYISTHVPTDLEGKTVFRISGYNNIQALVDKDIWELIPCDQ
jgi:hypothetical protein